MQPYLDQLHSADPAARRQAIIALGKQKDPAALGALADVYQSDPDPALRELAYKAGRYIKANAVETPAQPEPETAAIGDRAVSGRNIERAKGYFDRALDYQVRHDYARAAEMMGKAIEANPQLRDDSMFVNMAIELTGKGSGAAIATLRDPVARAELIDHFHGVAGEPAGKRKGRPRPANADDWGPALLDIGIYGLVNGAIIFVLALVAIQALAGFILNAFNSASAGMPPNMVGLQDLAGSRAISLPLAAFYAIVYALISMVSLLMTDGAVHLVATTVMGGEGTLPGLIRKTTLFFTVLVPISMLVSLLPALMRANPDTNAGLSLLSLAFGIGTAVWAGKLTGEAYDFGTARGCMSMFLGSLALGLLFACCFFTLGMALMQSFGSVRM